MYAIIGPVITKFTNGKLEISSDFDLEKYQDVKQVSNNKLEINNKFSIKEMYISNLKLDLKTKIEAKGFLVDNIDISISNDDEYKLQNIKVKIAGKKEESQKTESNVIGIVDTIEKVSVSISSKVTNEKKDYEISNKDSKLLKEYISNIYDINQNQIYIV